MKNWILHLLQGVGIGAANVIAGVSGGTVALIFGIYERLIDIVRAAVHSGLALVRLNGAAFVSGVRRLPWTFILPLVAGIVLATLVGARFIPAAMERWPVHSRAAFFGLIVGSLAIPWLRIRTASIREVLLAAVAAVVAFALTGLPPREVVDPTLVQFYLAGAVGICAMVLPGVSGAFLLLVLGLYEPVLRAIDRLDVAVVATFVAGTASGLAVFALIMAWLLQKYHDQTMAILVGLMAGSLRALWPWLGAERELRWMDSAEGLGGVLLVFLAGLIVSGVATLYELRKSPSEKSADSDPVTGRGA